MIQHRANRNITTAGAQLINKSPLRPHCQLPTGRGRLPHRESHRIRRPLPRIGQLSHVRM